MKKINSKKMAQLKASGMCTWIRHKYGDGDYYRACMILEQLRML